jgi:hypothetical protein
MKTVFPLDELVLLLRAKGYALSVEQVLQLEEWLLSGGIRDVKGSAALKYWIAPLVAKNALEQAAVYALVDGFITSRLHEPNIGSKAFLRRIFRNRHFVFRLKIFVLAFVLLVAAAVFVGHQYQVRQQGKPVVIPGDKKNRIEPRQGKIPVLPRDTISLSPIALEQPGFRAIVRLYKPIVPEPIEYALQVSCFLGVLLGVILFIALFDKSRKDYGNVKTSHSVEAPSHSSEQSVDELWDEGDNRMSPLPEKSEIIFADQRHLIRRDSGWQQLRSNLLRARNEALPRLDIAASILATTRHAGLPTLVHTSKSFANTYVVIIDNRTSGSLFTFIAQELTNYLLASRLPMERFYLLASGELMDDHGRIHSWPEMVSIYPERQFLFFGPTEMLLDQQSNSLGLSYRQHQPQVSGSYLFSQNIFPGIYKKEMNLLGVTSASAELESLVFVSAAIAGRRSLVPGKLSKENAAIANGAEARPESIADVKRFLGPDLFPFLCCLAVFPRIDFQLLIGMYARYIDDGHSPGCASGPGYDELLQLSKIPWLRAGRLDPDKRLALLDALEPTMEAWAREVLLDLMRDAEQKKPGTAEADEYLEQYHLNAFLLYVSDEDSNLRYKGSYDIFPRYWNKIDDWTLRVRTHTSSSGLLPAFPSGNAVTIDQYLLREQQFETRNLTVTRVAVLMLPALLLYILFSVIKPAALYPAGDFKRISYTLVIKSDDPFRKAGKDVWFRVPGKLDPTPVSQLHGLDSFSVKNVEYGVDKNIEVHDPRRRELLLSVPSTYEMVEIQLGSSK